MSTQLITYCVTSPVGALGCGIPSADVAVSIAVDIHRYSDPYDDDFVRQDVLVDLNVRVDEGAVAVAAILVRRVYEGDNDVEPYLKLESCVFPETRCAHCGSRGNTEFR